ncbi:serine hydrolase domain-containing protein [Corallococcus interemptor]|nr:serine hydrolase [Corallococcus interemptor]
MASTRDIRCRASRAGAKTGEAMLQRMALLCVVCLMGCGGKRLPSGPGSPPDPVEDGWDPESPGNEERMYGTDDWARFIVDVPMRDEPGTVTRYCTGGVVLLGAVLEHVSGRSIADLSRDWLFSPMQVQDVTWQPAGKTGTDTGGHLRLRPRDFLKVGQLMLDGGAWHGERQVSEAWVTESGKALGPLGDVNYGLLWWSARFVIQGTPVEVTFARGNGGQYVFVAPSLGVTAAFTGSHYNDAGSAFPLVLFGQYVLPAALGLERPGTGG